MSKRLILGRHGDAPFGVAEIRDIDRTLSETGILENIDMSEYLKDCSIKPDLILCSHASRALHTAMMHQRHLKLPLSVVSISETIYTNRVMDILNLLYNLDDSLNTVMLIGHNPTITELSNVFFTNRISMMDTSGMSIFEFDSDTWKAIDNGLVTSEQYLYPDGL